MSKKYILFCFLTLFSTAIFLAVGVRNAASLVQHGYHDFTVNGNGGFASYIGDINLVEINVCFFCHTPHHANSNQTYTNNPITDTGVGSNLNGSYLWNRRVPLASAFVPYTSSTMKVSTSAGPGALSLLCLSCHDGIGAINVLLNYPGNAPIAGLLNAGEADQFGDANDQTTISALNIGGATCTGDGCSGPGPGGRLDLRDDHPIGFDYDEALGKDPTGLKPITGGPLFNRMIITGRRVECNTCHDPHITDTTANRTKFLVVSNEGSNLCLQCHIK